jgi:hypothetical protein
MKLHSTRRVAETLAAIALLMVATVLTRCAPKPEPLAIAPTPVTVQRIIILRAPDVAPPKSRAGRAVKAYREEERNVPDSVGYPGASADQIREIYRAERAAHGATQHMINRDGRATRQDQDAAKEAIDALRKAQQAPREGTPEELKP